MFPIKLLGIAVAAGAGLGIWASGAIKEKLNGGGFTKVKKSKIQIVEIPADRDVRDVQIVVSPNGKKKVEET